MADPAQSFVIAAYALLAAAGLRGLLRKHKRRDALAVAIITAFTLAIALYTVLANARPSITTALDLLLQRLLSDDLIRSLGFRMP